MYLTIDADLVAELVESPNAGPSHETGIYLTANGWETGWQNPEEWQYPVALTVDDVHAFSGGDIDPDILAAMVESLTTYDHDPAVSHESGTVDDLTGSIGSLTDDMTPAVVTGSMRVERRGRTPCVLADEHAWETAWWFDHNTARQVTTEPAGLYADKGEAMSLWCTETCRWVVRTRSVRGGPHQVWSEIDADTAAQWVYDADAGAVAANLPPLAEGARAARDLANTITPPPVHADRDGNATTGTVDERQSAEVFAALGALSNLIRARLLPDLRGIRSRTAANLLRSGDPAMGRGGLGYAAAVLGVAPSTLSNLLHDRRPAEGDADR